MAYKSKFNKPKSHDDSEFVLGGVAYAPFSSKDESEEDEYDFSYYSGLGHPSGRSGIIGSIEFNIPEDSYIEDGEYIDTGSLDDSSEDADEANPIDLSTEGASTGQGTRKMFTPDPYLRSQYNQFVDVYRRAGAPENELGFWANIAQNESTFRHDIHGKTKDGKYEALGYFQMLTVADGKPMDVAGQYSGVSHQTFLNDPIIQIQSAQRMKNDALRQLTDKDWAAADAKGYTASALVAGVWAGGIDGLRAWLHRGVNRVDANVRNHPDASRRWKASVAGRMEDCNNYFKDGGVLMSPSEVRNILKAQGGVKMPKNDLFGMSEYHGYTPTWDDLYNFTKSYEGFDPVAYDSTDENGNVQKLIGHGIALRHVDPETAERWLKFGITEAESLKWMKDYYAKLDQVFSDTVKNYDKLPMELKVPILDAAYNTKGTEFFNSSPNLKAHIENGDHYVTIAAELDHSMNHSVDKNNKNLGSWLAVRSACRRAMALGQYDYKWSYTDKQGRQLDPTKTVGKQDWKASPHYGKYKTLKTDYADHFR